MTDALDGDECGPTEVGGLEIWLNILEHPKVFNLHRRIMLCQIFYAHFMAKSRSRWLQKNRKVIVLVTFLKWWRRCDFIFNFVPVYKSAIIFPPTDNVSSHGTLLYVNSHLLVHELACLIPSAEYKISWKHRPGRVFWDGSTHMLLLQVL